MGDREGIGIEFGDGCNAWVGWRVGRSSHAFNLRGRVWAGCGGVVDRSTRRPFVGLVFRVRCGICTVVDEVIVEVGGVGMVGGRMVYMGDESRSIQ